MTILAKPTATNKSQVYVVKPGETISYADGTELKAGSEVFQEEIPEDWAKVYIKEPIPAVPDDTYTAANELDVDADFEAVTVP